MLKGCLPRRSSALQRLNLCRLLSLHLRQEKRQDQSGRAERHGESFEDLVDRWIAEVKPLPKSGYSKRRMARALAVFVRHDRPGELTKRDVLDWKEAMISQGLHHKTINSRLSALRALFKWGVKNERLASNPFVGVTVEGRKTGGKARLPYTDEEAKLILHAARGQSGFRRWVPLVLAYSGARLDEICQCFGRDIRREGETWFVDINDNDQTKALKNGAQTARKVPIHEQVIAEGFLDHLRSIQPDEPLFWDIKPDRFGRRGGNASKVLARWVRSLGVTDPRKAPSHSWRHRFKDLCRAAGIEKSIHDALTGHASRDVGDGYGLGYPLAVLAAAIAKLPHQG